MRECGAGIHFRTADVQGAVLLGNKVAQYLKKHYSTASAIALNAAGRRSIHKWSPRLPSVATFCVLCHTGSLAAATILSKRRFPRRKSPMRSIIIATGDLAVCAEATVVEALSSAVSLLRQGYGAQADRHYRRIWRFWTVIGEPSAMNAERGG